MSASSISTERKGPALNATNNLELTSGNDGDLEDNSLQLQRRMFTPFLLKTVPPIPDELERVEYPDYPRYTRPIEWIFFTWLIPVMNKGYKRTLVPADMFRLSKKMSVEPLAERFQANFNRRIVTFKENHIKRKIELRGETLETNTKLREEDLDDFEPGAMLGVWSLFDTFRSDYISALGFMTAALAIQTTEPLLSKRLINYVSLKTLGYDMLSGQGVGLAIGVGVMLLFTCVFINHAFFLSTFIGARTRGLLTKVILDKSFRLSAHSKKRYPPSKITSIMSTDVSRIDLGIGFSLWTFCFPVPICIAIGILVYNIRAPALVGVGLMVLYLVFAGSLGMLLFKFRTEALKQTDSRVALVKEVLNNLKIIKLYSWEIPYFKMISKIRKAEMKNLLKMEIVRSVIISVASCLTSVSSYAAFLVLYAIAPPGRRNPANIFSSVALFALLSNALIVLPLSLAALIDMIIGIGRVSNYLASEELNEHSLIADSSSSVGTEKSEHAVVFEKACFEWEIFEDESEDEDSAKTLEARDAIKKRKKEKKKAKEAAIKQQLKYLRERKKNSNAVQPPAAAALFGEKKSIDKPTFKMGPLNLEIRHGEFIAITGQIGCGKSSLLQAIGGIMKRTSGIVEVDGKLITCGAPWVQNATVKNNILFGLPYDEEWYERVIFSTCLQNDLDMLPAGDQTEVGERGITLSGGQKARLCLARAIYAKPTIILLDDVLSAVDAKVGKHIMDHCIMGLLKDITRVLATHQLSLISSADRVIFMDMNGETSINLMEGLKESSPAFRALMELNSNKKSSEEDDDDDDIKMDLGREIQESEKKTERKFDEGDGVLMTEEEKSVNAIGFDVVWQYIGTGARGFFLNWIIPFALFCTVMQVFFELFQNNWLSFWIEYKFKNRDNGWYIGLYTLFMLLSVIFNITLFACIVYIMNRASRILNIEACRRIFYVPMAYMDVTPMGRIINRFTKDTDVLDNEMGDKIAMVTLFSCFLSGVLILCSIYLPWFAIAIPFIVFVFMFIANFYQASGREIKRLEAVQRSKVYNNFNETLTGMDTIKIYQKNNQFLDKNSVLINNMNEAYFITVANQRWLDISVSVLTTGFVTLISFLCVFKVFSISPASVGLLLSYILSAAGLTSMLVVVFTQVEQDMNSAERVLEYVHHLPQEADYIISETAPPSSWPEKGAIEFKDVQLSYRPGLPLVLQNFTATIGANEKIGICGRTGAGKSSIMVALYRIAELTNGSISIDGRDISTLGLNNLRSKLSIIPQDSVLFDGTVRKNLDPFNEKTDEQLWSVLRRTNIIDAAEIEQVKAQKSDDKNLHRFHLDRVVENEGANFSLGERQLVSFARALVRDSKILVLDEATSSVDYATDKKIQDAIVAEFSHCTILCIAHRLKTILNYDRVIVMDKGLIVEFDTPKNLFNNINGQFRQMCEKTGITSADFS